MIIDPDTGLPQLPEGYYYETRRGVSGDGFFIDIWRTETRRFLWWTWDKAVSTGFMGYVGERLTKEDVLFGAEQAYDDMYPDIDYGDMSLLGKFPPNSINS